MAKRRPIQRDTLYEYRNERTAKPPSKNNKTVNKTNRLLFVVVCVTIAITIYTFMLFVTVFTRISDIISLRKEYSSLKEPTENMEIDTPDKHYISMFDARLRQINPDYSCWIKIDGTDIDYPVVRGNDNEKYLNSSFYGEENVYGTLFMDYRCKGEYVPHVIIYGHNTTMGDMFSGLHKFLDESYLPEHPIITIKANDRIVEYDIFSVRKTDITDPAYYLDFSIQGSFRSFAERCGAPPDSAQIITLSTCVSGNDKDERIVVQGVLR